MSWERQIRLREYVTRYKTVDIIFERKILKKIRKKTKKT